MSDDRPNRRTEEPTPTAEPVEAGTPTVVESHGEPIVVDGHTPDRVLVEPGEPAEDGPAHRAPVPVDGVETPAEPVVIEHPVAEAPVRRGSRPAAVAVPEEERGADRTAERSRSEAPAAVAVPAAAPAADRDEPAAETRAYAAPATAETPAPVPARRDPRPEDSAPVPPVPTPTAPVAETAAAPVAAPPAPHTVYVESPTPPKKKGNRGFAIVMSLLATIVYALIWAGVAAAVIAIGSDSSEFGTSFTNFLMSPVFWIPVLVFAAGMILVSLILNRAGWAWWILLGFVVAVVVYFGYLGGALLTVAQQITSAEVGDFLNRVAITPLAIGAAVVAREVSIWTGLVISARGKRMKARNAAARADFDHETAERKAEYERAQAGYSDN